MKDSAEVKEISCKASPEFVLRYSFSVTQTASLLRTIVIFLKLHILHWFMT